MGKRRKSRMREDIPLREQFKPIFKKRFLEMFNESEVEYEKFLDFLLMKQRKSFRVNTLKCGDVDSLVDGLRDKGFEISPVPWSRNAFYVNFVEGERIDLGNLYEHFLGLIYVQESTSMCPVELLEIPEEIDNNFSVLDMAASPGSKTTQIGCLMKNKGILVANELDYRRIGPLRINLERTGISNIVITNLDGRNIEGEERFDRVLLDAPCSGSGVIRKSTGTIKTYNPKRLKGIANLQFKLFVRAFELLKKGGVMTYSTCSMDPEENEMVVARFLREVPEAELLQAELNGIVLNNKLSAFNDKEFGFDIVDKTIRIWPQDNDTNGFFVAKVRKN